MRRALALLLLVGLAGCADSYQTFQPPPLEYASVPTTINAKPAERTRAKSSSRSATRKAVASRRIIKSAEIIVSSVQVISPG